MTRKTPTPSTIKQLFALSGNICAFPDCDAVMVHEDGTILGEVCHIEAAEEGGERYNPKQTDEERRHFSNLVLLCSRHHKITNNVEKYPAEKLRELKKAHEEQHRNQQYAVPSGIPAQVSIQLQNLYQLTQKGDGTQIVHVGMSYSEVRSLVLDLFEKNFPNLQEMASQAAERNVRSFCASLHKRISKDLDPQDLLRLTDPDVQFVLTDATTQAARSQYEWSRELLAALVVQRIRAQNLDLLKIATNEAISVVGRLTQRQMRIMTLSFILDEYLEFLEFRSWRELDEYLSLHAYPFLEIGNDILDFRQLESTGCATRSAGSSRFSFPRVLRDRHKNLFSGLRPEHGEEHLREAIVRKLELGSIVSETWGTTYLWTLTLAPVGVVIACCYFDITVQQRLKMAEFFDKYPGHLPIWIVPPRAWQSREPNT